MNNTVTDSAWDHVKMQADRMGLTLGILTDGRENLRVVVSRAANGPQDWSLEETAIAIGRDPKIVVLNAMSKLQEMAPRLQKKLDELDPAHEAVLPAYGVGADGTITALRVERDGSVRLNDGDIERIAAAVVRLAREDTGERGMEYLRAMAGAEILTVDTGAGHTDGCTPGVHHRAADGSGNCPCECHRWRPGIGDD